jgi:hypothetical protein
MLVLEDDEELDLDHIIVGITHSDQVWYADPKHGEFGGILIPDREEELIGDVLICLFHGKVERLKWLRKHAENPSMLDPTMSIEELTRLGEHYRDEIPTNIYAVLDYIALLPHAVGTSLTLTP